MRKQIVRLIKLGSLPATGGHDRRQKIKIGPSRGNGLSLRLHRRTPPAGPVPRGGGDEDGYSRTVYCNGTESPEALDLNYPDNFISTTKYTVANFIPKSLSEQYRRVANFIFLIVACFPRSVSNRP